MYTDATVYIRYIQIGDNLDIIISNASGKPIYEQITTQVKNLIIANQLHEGEPLPSLRLLAKELRISVITTKRAYDDLERDGFIETVAGKGCFVARRDTSLIREEQMKKVEQMLQEAIDIAQASAISCEELVQVLQLLYKGE